MGGSRVARWKRVSCGRRLAGRCHLAERWCASMMFFTLVLFQDDIHGVGMATLTLK